MGPKQEEKKFWSHSDTVTPLIDPSTFEFDQKKKKVKKGTKKWLKINKNFGGIKFDKNWWKFGKLCAILIEKGFR